VADRLDKCVLVLDEGSTITRRVPVDYPDAVALSARTGALYVTTRFGCERSGRGQVGLVKFDDWQNDDEPSVSLPDLASTWYTGHYKHSYVVLCEKPDCTNVWVAYTELPVRIYADDGKEFKLLKDFRQLGAEQGCHGFDRIGVDRKTDTVYVGDNHSTFWKISNWKQPQFVELPLKAASVAIDPRHRLIFANPGGSVWQKHGITRHYLDKEDCPPVNVGDSGSNVVTEKLWTEWCFTGNSDLGFDVAPDGSLAGLDQRGVLHFFHGTEQKAPWQSIELANFKDSGAFGGVRFDPAGNLYIGCRDGEPWKIPPPFEDDRFAGRSGRTGCSKIVKYAPTGTPQSGNLFPSAPEAPGTVYEVNFGAFDASCIRHTPRFDVDESGRIYYPTSIEPRVTVMDNAGNEILHFGTWGNRDSTGGLPGDLVPTTDIPLALPNSVAATDDYIYVADMVNLRILRIKKDYALEAHANGE
jgi:DNA-binding beta-propeller fold protein YncE